MAAARAWWVFRYFGLTNVRVLDGGQAAWQATERPAADPGDVSGGFVATPGHMPMLDAEGAAAVAASGVLLDARAPERFAGEVEPMDPVAGHIPGATNTPTTANVDETGHFLPAAELRERFEKLGVDDCTEVGVYCGSGVTAAHEALALDVAGLPATVYIGSSSEWITDPARPIATGKP